MPHSAMSAAPHLEKKKRFLGSGRRKSSGASTSEGADANGSSADAERLMLHSDPDQSELSSAMATQNDAASLALRATRPDLGDTLGAMSLNNTCRTAGEQEASPFAKSISPDGNFANTFRSNPSVPRDVGPNLISSAAASLEPSPAAAVLPVSTHADPSDKRVAAPLAHKRRPALPKHAGHRSPSQHGSGGGAFIVKKPPPPQRRVSPSQPIMFNTSPGPSPQQQSLNSTTTSTTTMPLPVPAKVPKRHPSSRQPSPAAVPLPTERPRAPLPATASQPGLWDSEERAVSTPPPPPRLQKESTMMPSALEGNDHAYGSPNTNSLLFLQKQETISVDPPTPPPPAAVVASPPRAAEVTKAEKKSTSPSPSGTAPVASAPQQKASSPPLPQPQKYSPQPQPRPAAAMPKPKAASAASKTYIAPMNTHESPEYLPTDAPNILVPARKYAYDVKTCTWKEVEIMVRVLHPNRGVSQGAMRVCFVVEELDERGFSTPMVAKMFRHTLSNVVDDDYFNEGEAQCISGVFAEKFNHVEVPKSVDRFVVSFLQCDTVRIRPKDLPEEYQNKRSGFFSYRTTDSRDVLFTMEPRLKGNFTKYTNNYGDVYEGFEQRLDNEKEQKRHEVLLTVEAFAHFTLEDSGGSMLVCDLQGVNDFLTDPQIHTEDGKGLGMGNMGQKGIDKWVEKHVCNEVCRAMHLKPLIGPVRSVPLVSDVDTRVSYYKILRSNLRSQTPTRLEDVMPPPKPLSQMTDQERLEYAIMLSQLLS